MKGDCHKLKEEIKKLSEDYGFKGLFHFTEFSNLKSIIDIGYLCSRALCYANNIDFMDACPGWETAQNDVKSCTRFYYDAPKNQSANLEVPVYLLFSEDLICFDLSIFSDGDAHSMYTKFGTDHEFFSKKIDWNSVFNKCVPSDSHTGLLSMQRKSSAEMLIDEPVPIKYMKNVIFRCSADYKRACSLFGKNKMFRVEPEIFDFCRNFIKDYSIIYNENLDKKVFIVHFCTNEAVEDAGNNEYALIDLDGNLIGRAKIGFPMSDSTDFCIEITKTEQPVRFNLYFNGMLSIDETIG